MSGAAIGVDLGGTTCKIGLVTPDGEIADEREFDTPETPEEVVDRIAQHVRELLPGAGVESAIGVGVPGPVLVPDGVIERAPNLGWEDVAFGPMLSDALDLDAIVDNDAGVAALGEHWTGVAAGADVLLTVTLGTGVGGGVVIGGSIYHGACGRSAEIGHVVVDPEGPGCTCGKRGCVESFFSARAFDAIARDALGESVDTEAVFAAYGREEGVAGSLRSASRRGDPSACRPGGATTHDRSVDPRGAGGRRRRGAAGA